MKIFHIFRVIDFSRPKAPLVNIHYHLFTRYLLSVASLKRAVVDNIRIEIIFISKPSMSMCLKVELNIID